MSLRSMSGWRKSSRSGGGDNCVEIAFTTNRTIAVRDSKDPAGPILSFIPAAWTAFTAALREGQLQP